MAASKPLSRRKRKLRRLTGWLSAFAVLIGLGAYFTYRAQRPAVRTPGEDLVDITRSLSKDLPDGAPTPTFTDVTDESGLGGFRTFLGERSSQLPEDMGSGAAWGDFDRDGDDDLFLVAAGGPLTADPADWAESMLFENLGNASFRRVMDFPEIRIAGMGAAWGDYDNDGWLDLAVSGYGSLQLFKNSGTRESGVPRFVLDRSLGDRPGYWAGLSWADFDNDGLLDLYVCGYVQYREDAAAAGRSSSQAGTTVPYTLNPASYEPEPNLLFHNQGDGRFAEVALLYGVSNPEGRSLSALWHDFDDDGRIDLYVANDISDNALLLNRGETFEDVSLAAWVADYRGAMGLAAGDWNRDGDDDLFVTHWVAQENALYDSQLAENRAAGRSQLTFRDLAAPLGLGQMALHAVGWGTEFADFDNDGWLDLVVANGSTLETQETPKRLKRQPMMLLWNDGGEHFYDLAPGSELLQTPRLGRGLATSDYDRDGDLDILMVELDGGARLLRNDTQSGHWLELSLSTEPEPRLSNPGTTVTVRAGDLALRRTVGGASYLSQSTHVLHFGLGATDSIDAVDVKWRDGRVETVTDVSVDAAWEIKPGGPPKRLSRPVPDAASRTVPADERQRTLAFWTAQRAAMDAMKREGDIDKAISLFERALDLNPAHEDSRYYLGNLLWSRGEYVRALGELDRLRREQPLSHRAHKQWGVLRAMSAVTAEELDLASEALERAVEINAEETGGLLALGEISILRGRPAEADKQLEWACRSNPRAVGGFYLRAFLAHQGGDTNAARSLLDQAVAARGPEWKPEGTAAEGDVRRVMHVETSPLARFWREWDGTPDPARAFHDLDAFLEQPLTEAPR